MFIINGCYWDHPPVPEPIDPATVSFQGHILPILESKCATSFCHDGTKNPDLRADVAYNNIKADGLINTTFPAESGLYKTVEWLPGIDPMPPGGPQISEKDRVLILAWIEGGARNN